jgi:hypothetical protein
MKTLLITLAILISSSYAMANCKSQGDLFVTEGKEVSLDVLGKSPVKVVLETRESSTYSTPTLQVSNNYAGFECFPKSVQLLSKDTDYQCWLVEIDWSPGADVSGCEIKISHDSWEKSALVNLFMNY